MGRKKLDPNGDISIADARRIGEGGMAALHKALGEHEFSSTEEADEFIQKLLRDNDGQFPKFVPETPQEKALEVVYEALSAAGKKRIELARKALEIDPDCADAYVLLADEVADTPQEAVPLYRKALAAAERSLGPEYFSDPDLIGRFWGLLETRPYMRAGDGLGTALWYSGERDEAITVFDKLIRLNPDDNQGLRHKLIPLLVTAGRDEGARKLLRQYDDDDAPVLGYMRALLAFRKYGGGKKALKALEKAYNRNRWVPVYMFSAKEPKELPAYYAPYSEDEAIMTLVGIMEPIDATDEAIDWMMMSFLQITSLISAQEHEEGRTHEGGHALRSS